MGKKVLAAVSADSVPYHTIHYGIHLAARIKSSLSLIVVSSGNVPSETSESASFVQEVGSGQCPWLDQALDEGQRAGVSLEIFFSTGNFFEEVLTFVRSQPSIQFIVMASSEKTRSKDESNENPGLKRLHSVFEGEILLV